MKTTFHVTQRIIVEHRKGMDDKRLREIAADAAKCRAVFWSDGSAYNREPPISVRRAKIKVK